MKDKYTINNLTFKFNRMKKHLFAALIAACAVVTTACDDTEETKYFYGFGTVALRNEQVVIKQYDYTYYTNLLNTNFNYSDGDRVYFECRSTTEYSEKEYAVSVIGISYNIKKDIVRYADFDAVPDSVNGSAKITPTPRRPTRSRARPTTISTSSTSMAPPWPTATATMAASASTPNASPSASTRQ